MMPPGAAITMLPTGYCSRACCIARTAPMPAEVVSQMKTSACRTLASTSSGDSAPVVSVSPGACPPAISDPSVRGRVAVVSAPAGSEPEVSPWTSTEQPAPSNTTATRSTARTAGPGTVAMPDPNDLPYITLQHYGAELRGIYCYIHRAGSVGYALIWPGNYIDTVSGSRRQVTVGSVGGD